MTQLNKSDAPETKRGRGRPRVDIDLDLVQKLGAIACTDQEIASIIGVSYETFKRRKHEDNFAELLEQSRSKGKASLRRLQWKLAESGNAAMCIWLGKQMLNLV
jgi:hypothetical protein